MDSFQVKAADTSVLSDSHIVSELRAELYDIDDMFPVLIDGQIGYFHDIDGGYSNAVNGSGYHIVNLIHRVQGPDSPPNKIYDDTIELHLNDHFYNLAVDDIWQMGDYPDEDFILSLKVTDYKMGPYSFSDAMSAPIDKRHEEYDPNE